VAITDAEDSSHALRSASSGVFVRTISNLRSSFRISHLDVIYVPRYRPIRLLVTLPYWNLAGHIDAIFVFSSDTSFICKTNCDVFIYILGMRNIIYFRFTFYRISAADILICFAEVSCHEDFESRCSFRRTHCRITAIVKDFKYVSMRRLSASAQILTHNTRRGKLGKRRVKTDVFVINHDH